MPDEATRNQVLATMVAQRIHATFHYVPLHSSPAGRRFAARPSECPVTDDISARLLRLPFYTDLTEADAQRVLESFVAAVGSATP
jgi:dTDP-4-amino-4,6-dideoxygalactose transaminase